MTYQKISGEKSMIESWAIGNGQVHDALCPSKEISKTLNCMEDPAKIITGGYEQVDNNSDYVVRRLTPVECERLQGYDDGWTDIPGASDTARYKALGNSIALPQWQIIIDNMAKYLPEKATLGSLFDGISGFCLCWERTFGLDTAKWASEIEKFPIEVCKYHFGDEETGAVGDVAKYLERPTFGKE